MTKIVESISAFTDDSLGTDDAVAISEKIKNDAAVLPTITQHAINRAKFVNPKLNAIAVEDFDGAIARAKNPIQGNFYGVPTFIKDTDEVTGIPLHLGSRALPGNISTKLSKAATQLLGSGLNYLGTTTTPEFGLTGTTESLKFGATKNPWNLAYSTGGSSGGSAAMVASGVVPIAHANDGAGSIRIPASCCGLVGLKASRDRIKDKEMPGYFPANILHDGVVTRSVRDTWTFHAAIEEKAPARGLPPIGRFSTEKCSRLKIAVITETCTGASCSDDLIEATINVAKQCESFGHQVKVVPNPFYAKFDDDFWLSWAHIAFLIRYTAKKDFDKNFDHRQLEQWAKYLIKRHWKNLHHIPSSFKRLRRFSADYEKFFQECDILLTPTLGTTVPKLGFFGPEVEGQTHWERIYEFLPFTKYQNISGAPAITLPCATDSNGLPIGIQLASRLGADRLVLELSLQLEANSNWRKLSEI